MAKRHTGWIVSLLISFSPLIFWYFSLLPFQYRISNSYSLLTSLGEITSLIGMAMYSVVLVMSARIQAFEDFFGGMNRVYIWHHLLGGVALILFLIHPILLAFARATYSIKAASALLLPGEDWTVNFGIAALLLMIALLILTFFRSLPYQIWQLTHKFLGVVFIIGAIHAFYVSSDISRFLPLTIYMFILVNIGVIAYFYRTVYGSFFVRRLRYIVDEVTPVRENVVHLTLLPQGKPIKVIPGQFIFIQFISKAISKEVHPFSVSSVFTDGRISLVIKKEGDYTARLRNLQKGDTAFIEGGFGRFFYKFYKNKNQVWIAGGIGIVPFLSMAQQVANSEYQVHLVYSVHGIEEAVYLDDLRLFAQANSNFHVYPFESKTQGRLSADSIAQLVGDLKIFDFFLCGPPPMMGSIRSQLKKHKIASSNIHSEEFSL